jgi:glycosyltransferase involved in cell wall biosynthesis
LKYLRWAYNSIRKNQGDHEVEICVADDASTDMTWKWCQEKMNYDPYFKAIRNNGPERQGLVILNDKLINEVATNDICMVYHADMYLCPGAIDAIEKHMYGTAEEPVVESRIVSLTRIEPPLHPPGPEKVLRDFGIEPEDFDEEGLLKEVQELKELHTNDPGVTEGIFAPWAFWKEDFQQIGGHDKLFAPQSKEDSDIFNRFHLNGVEFIQTWEGFVYHMTSRGSRFNPSAGGAPGQDSPEWIGTTTKNTREFIRKWGHMIQHDKYMKPIVPPKYNVGIRIENCRDLQLLEAIEPWCDIIYTDGDIDNYIAMEQPKTSYDLSKRVHSLTDNDRYDYDDILIEIDGNTFSNESFRHIQHLSEILANDNLELGTFKLGDIKITINNIETYEKDLIICKK